jgi:hypothetical protein
MNNGIQQILRSAEAQVRQRLQTRPLLPAEAILLECQIKEETREPASKLLDQLGAVLGVEPGHLRPADRLGEILRVRKEELEPSPPEAAWRKAGLGTFVEVFSYEVMHTLERLSTQRGWSTKQRELEPRPGNEEEWLDRIMAMTLCEFLSFFADTMPVKKPA